MKTLDLLEQEYNLRPTPSRVLREKSNYFDSPSNRITPRNKFKTRHITPIDTPSSSNISTSTSRYDYIITILETTLETMTRLISFLFITIVGIIDIITSVVITRINNINVEHFSRVLVVGFNVMLEMGLYFIRRLLKGKKSNMYFLLLIPVGVYVFKSMVSDITLSDDTSIEVPITVPVTAPITLPVTAPITLPVVEPNQDTLIEDLKLKLNAIQLQIDINTGLYEEELYRMKNEIRKLASNLDMNENKKQMRPDYSLESAGAFVESSSKSFYSDYKMFSSSIEGQPRAVLQESLQLGHCWGMKGNFIPYKGSTGFIQIQLARSITPTAISISHPNHLLLYKNAYKSAPRTIKVFIVRMDVNVLIGELQFNPLEKETAEIEISNHFESIDRIRFEISSNWGNQDFTCVYKLSVYGREDETLSK